MASGFCAYLGLLGRVTAVAFTGLSAMPAPFERQVRAAYVASDAAIAAHRRGLTTYLSPDWVGFSRGMLPIGAARQRTNEEIIRGAYSVIRSVTKVEDVQKTSSGLSVRRKTTLTLQHVDPAGRAHKVVSWTSARDLWKLVRGKPALCKTVLLGGGGSVDGRPAGRGSFSNFN